MIITPSEVENAATDIVEYWEKSKLADADKRKILTMVMEFYRDRNEHNVDQWLQHLCNRELMKQDPEMNNAGS